MNNFFRKDAVLSVFVLLVFAGLIAAIGNAPTQGGNLDNWGTTLNAWVGTTINTTGGFLNTLSVNSSAIVGANVINSSHIVNGNNGVQLADMAEASVNSTHIADASIELDDIADEAVNSTQIVNGTIVSADIAFGHTLNVSAVRLNVSSANFTLANANFTNTTLLTKIKVVYGVVSALAANSTNVSDGDVGLMSIIILTLGANGTIAPPCSVANLSVGNFNVTCSPGTASYRSGTPDPFTFNYMLINSRPA